MNSLSIIIPTRCRGEALIKNVQLLKKYIEENYSWSGVAEKLENLFLELQSNASGEEEKL